SFGGNLESDTDFSIDTTPPTVTLTQVNGSSVTFPFSTNGNVSSVGGSCTTGDGPVSVTRAGSHTAPPTAPCAPGTRTLTLMTPPSAEATYTPYTTLFRSSFGGNLESDTDFSIDTTPPTVTLTQVNGSSVTFPFSTNGNVSSVGGSCATGDGPVSVT